MSMSGWIICAVAGCTELADDGFGSSVNNSGERPGARDPANSEGERSPRLVSVLTLVQELTHLIHSESLADLFGHAFTTLTRAVPFDLGVAVMLEQNLDLYVSTPIGGKPVGDELAVRVRSVLHNVIPAGFTTTEIVVKDERQDLPGGAETHAAMQHQVYSILRQENRTAGIVLICRAGPEFSEDDQRVVEIFSAQLSMLLDNLRARDKIISLAERDDLTGIPNRRYFRRHLMMEMERLRVYNVPLSLILIDVDEFKAINDTFGHVMGDVVLSELSGAIKGTLRSPDNLSRFGGDEFGVILPHTDSAGASAVAERILKLVRELEISSSENGVIKCTISIGIAQCQPDDSTLDDFVRRADECLYDAKRQGKNRFTL
jgi:diguanylate cyclase (GGDEF)-like protein